MNRDDQRKSLWIPYAFVAFFGLVVAVNGVMIYFATTTFSGVERGDAYKRGVGYNAVLAAAREQAALGWTATIDHTVLAANAGRLQVHVRDALGQPVGGAEVTAMLRRPTNAKLDFAAALVADGAGGYVTEIAWPAAGLWDVHVTVDAASGRRFQLDERLIVR